jgi:YYY domain-containing protein
MLRAYEPGIAGTEKPMDLAFLNGFLSAQRLPTQDSWLSGYTVPYYYFGYLVLATPGKLTGIAPAVVYNLAAATVPALAFVGFASVAWNLARSRFAAPIAALAAAFAGFFVVLAGHLAPALELLVSRGLVGRDLGQLLSIKNFAENVQAGRWPPDGVWWWRASRVVPNILPDGINETPFFSILLSDLHPHFVALAFEPLVLGVIAALVLSGGTVLASWWTRGAAALSLGYLLAGNTWDIAPFWLLFGMVAAIVSTATGVVRVRQVAIPFGLAVVCYLPYFIGYGGPPLGLGIVEERTPFGSFLVLFGWQMAILTALGLYLRSRRAQRHGWGLTIAGAVIGLILIVVGAPTLGFLAALLTLLFPWPRAPEGEEAHSLERSTQALAAFAVAILLGVELIFLRDAFGTRMNTVFKFHYNAWALSGLACALALAVLLARRDAWRIAGGALAALALAIGLVYPLSGIQTRTQNRPPDGLSLDGARALSSEERAATEWLRTQPINRPVIAEAVNGSYSNGGRIATFAGGATVLGWANHEMQWRGQIPELGRRETDLSDLYRGPAAEAQNLLRRYGVNYVVVGNLEREKYGDGVTTRFDNVLTVAFRSGRTVIYKGPV